MNRLNGLFGDDKPAPDSLSSLVSESFVECPSIFFQQLTPEQYAAKQQLYRAAFEKARKEANQGWDFERGDGI